MTRSHDSAGRDARIDALKGFAVICVIAYHTMGQYLIVAPKIALYSRELLFSFMLPLLAFLSGLVIGRRGTLRPKEYFARRTLGLMVPYLVWETLYGMAVVPSARWSLGGLGAYLANTLLNPHFEGRMWYLYALWIALMILGIVRLAGRDSNWVLGLSLALVLLWPWWGHFKRVQWLYSYVVLGVLARRLQGAWTARRRTLGFVGACAFVPLWLATRPEQLAVARLSGLLSGAGLSSVGAPVVYGLSTLAGIAAIVAIVSWSYRTPGWLLRSLSLPGRLSLGIYVAHFPFVEVWHEPPLLLIPVIIAFALAASMSITLLLRRWPVTASLLLGERWRSESLAMARVRAETQ